MRFNSQELGVKLGGTEDEKKPKWEDQTDECECGDCSIGCTYPTKPNLPEPEPPKPKKPPGGEGSHLAALELLRAQLRESLGSVAR